MPEPTKAQIAQRLTPPQWRDLGIIVRDGNALVRYSNRPAQALFRFGLIDRTPYGWFGFVVTPTPLGRQVLADAREGSVAANLAQVRKAIARQPAATRAALAGRFKVGEGQDA